MKFVKTSWPAGVDVMKPVYECDKWREVPSLLYAALKIFRSWRARILADSWDWFDLASRFTSPCHLQLMSFLVNCWTLNLILLYALENRRLLLLLVEIDVCNDENYVRLAFFGSFIPRKHGSSGGTHPIYILEMHDQRRIVCTTPRMASVNCGVCTCDFLTTREVG